MTCSYWSENSQRSDGLWRFACGDVYYANDELLVVGGSVDVANDNEDDNDEVTLPSWMYRLFPFSNLEASARKIAASF